MSPLAYCRTIELSVELDRTAHERTSLLTKASKFRAQWRLFFIPRQTITLTLTLICRHRAIEKSTDIVGRLWCIGHRAQIHSWEEFPSYHWSAHANRQ